MKTAVHFGAGNIGRGFLGQLYSESGLQTVFVDVREDVVRALNLRGKYPLRLVGEHERTVWIEHVGAILAEDFDEVADALAEARIASTAVGANAVGRLAPVLAEGLRRRAATSGEPLDLILAENRPRVADYLRGLLRQELGHEHAHLLNRIGLVEASVGRMVPVMTPELLAEDPLIVAAEPYAELPVDGDAFVGEPPEIVGLLPKPRFRGYFERKLFVHNAAHAAAAYLGHLRGHELIWQAMGDAHVAKAVEGLQRETCHALAHRWGHDIEELNAHAADLRRRFANVALGDQVARVAADPIRKLGPDDRLIGAMMLCHAEGIEPRFCALATAAALKYTMPGDPGAERLAALRQQGFAKVLKTVCGLTPHSPLWGRIMDALPSTN